MSYVFSMLYCVWIVCLFFSEITIVMIVMLPKFIDLMIFCIIWNKKTTCRLSKPTESGLIQIYPVTIVIFSTVICMWDVCLFSVAVATKQVLMSPSIQVWLMIYQSVKHNILRPVLHRIKINLIINNFVFIDILIKNTTTKECIVTSKLFEFILVE